LKERDPPLAGLFVRARRACDLGTCIGYDLPRTVPLGSRGAAQSDERCQLLRLVLDKLRTCRQRLGHLLRDPQKTLVVLPESRDAPREEPAYAVVTGALREVG